MQCTMASYSPRALPQHLIIENFIIPLSSDPQNDDSLSTLDFSLAASSTPLDLGSAASLHYSGDLKAVDGSTNEKLTTKSNQSPTPLKNKLPPLTSQQSPRFPSPSPMNTKASLLRRKGPGASPGRNAVQKMRRRSDLDIAGCPPPSPRRQPTDSQLGLGARYKSSPLRRSSTDSNSISERRRSTNSLPEKRRSARSAPVKRRSTETTSSISSSSSSRVSSSSSRVPPSKQPQPPNANAKNNVPLNKPVSILRRGVFHSGPPVSCSSPIKSPSTSSRRLSLRFSPWRARRRVTFDISSDESSVEYSTAESSMQFSDIVRVGGGAGVSNGDFLDDDLEGSGSINSFGFGNVSIGGGALNNSFFMMGDMSDGDLGPASLQATLPFADDCDDENSRFGHLYEEELQLKSGIVSQQEGNDAADSPVESTSKDSNGDDDSVSISSAEDSDDEDDVSISSANDEDPILGDMNPRSARVRAIERIKARINLPPPTPRRKQAAIPNSSSTNWDAIPLVSPHPIKEESVSNDSESVSPKGVQEFPEGSQGSPEGLVAKQAESGMIFSP